MSVPSRIATAVGGVALALLLSACLAPEPASGPPTGEPQGPLPPSNTAITLQQLAGLVTEADAPPQALFDVGAASTSGADLLSEQEYWVSVGGTPAECADIVSSPYLVASADAGNAARTDDPTGALASFTEVEDLFGLVQVYGRAFDDEATASGFLDGFTATVGGCSGYRFIGPEGDVTYDASGLRVVESSTAPAGTRVLSYSENVEGSDALSVGVTFIQRENAVVAVYSELYPSSTMTAEDVAVLVSSVSTRVGAL